MFLKIHWTRILLHAVRVVRRPRLAATAASRRSRTVRPRPRRRRRTDRVRFARQTFDVRTTLRELPARRKFPRDFRYTSALCLREHRARSPKNRLPRLPPQQLPSPSAVTCLPPPPPRSKSHKSFLLLLFFFFRSEFVRFIVNGTESPGVRGYVTAEIFVFFFVFFLTPIIDLVKTETVTTPWNGII